MAPFLSVSKDKSFRDVESYLREELKTQCRMLLGCFWFGLRASLATSPSAGGRRFGLIPDRFWNEFNNRQRGAIAPPKPDLDGACISPGPVFKSWGQLLEQFSHHRLVLNNRQGPSPRVEGPLFSQPDHPIGPAPQLLCFGDGRFDATVTQQGGHQVTHERQPVARTAIEFPPFF